MAIQGIYIISDIIVGKSYIGSTNSLERRLREHKSDLSKNKHANYHLQKLYNLGHKFKIDIFPLIDGEDRLAIEQALIDSEKHSGNLLNISLDVTSPCDWTGKKHTEETKRKLRDIASIRGMPQAVIEAARIANTGRPQTEEQRRATSERSKALMQDPTRRQAVKDFHTGRRHTPESIALMKEKTTGRTFTPQAIAARKLVMIGRIQSPEERARGALAKTGLKRIGQALCNIKASGIARRKLVMVDGKVYGDTIQTAKAFGITPANVVKRVNKTLSKYNGWVYSESDSVLTPG